MGDVDGDQGTQGEEAGGEDGHGRGESAPARAPRHTPGGRCGHHSCSATSSYDGVPLALQATSYARRETTFSATSWAESGPPKSHVFPPSG
jgi:hypothetical protein